LSSLDARFNIEVQHQSSQRTPITAVMITTLRMLGGHHD